MKIPEPQPFAPEWAEPDPGLLRPIRPLAPRLPLHNVFGSRIGSWIEKSAEAKGAPADYVMGTLLATVGALIGNARWASPWPGWLEPPVIWIMNIGRPSSGKSPAMDAVIEPLRIAEQALRKAALAERVAWNETSEVAKIVEHVWKDEVRAAAKARETPPEMPVACYIEPKPHVPRLVVNDATIERMGVILSEQPRGVLLMRDELAGFIENFGRYSSSAGGDRSFYIEAYGGRGYSVERLGRDPVTIDRLSIGILGGIQPDRLKSVLFKSDDDGLIARFLPIWPDPVPLCRPKSLVGQGLIEEMVEKILGLNLVPNAQGHLTPVILPFEESACSLMDDFRLSVRERETVAEGLMLSFLGKLPGVAARLALILAYMDWATQRGPEPHVILASHFARAVLLVDGYFVPMTARAYAGSSATKRDRDARRLVEIIRLQGWKTFSSREVMRLDRTGLATSAELDPILAVLEQGDCIRAVGPPAKASVGRPSRKYIVNPAVYDSET
ncbi:MAG: DUF3987 domain-containing protein [Maritimibacter sp.]|nr:DUF3987 domain-containing protein [Maritimibacter sp.]